MKGTFKKLADSIRSRNDAAGSDLDPAMFSDVLDEHLDQIAAAHHSVHTNVHANTPRLPEPEGGG